MAAKLEITAATRALRPLRDHVENFLLFEDEVEEVLSSLFEKHRSHQNSIERVRHSVLEVGSIIAGEVILWLKKLYRRLTPRKAVRNPWTAQVARDLPVEIFGFILEMVKKARSRYGVTYFESRSSDSVVYTEENRVVRDLSRLCDVPRASVLEYFSKKCKGARRGTVRVVVTAEKPFTVSYFKKGSQVVVKCYYKYTNEHGYTFES